MVANKVGHSISRGEAESVLHAFGNGGRTVVQHNRTGEGAPADHFGSHGSIRPFSGSEWDGAHFCADDWHVIVIADGDAPGHDDEIGRQGIAQYGEHARRIVGDIGADLGDAAIADECGEHDAVARGYAVAAGVAAQRA